MTEIRKLWPKSLPPIPEKELERLRGASAGLLAEAGCCFRLFRFLHRLESAEAVLMGDYCFGRFSAYLARIDSVEVTNAFGAFLKKDVLRAADMDEYVEFIKSASQMI